MSVLGNNEYLIVLIDVAESIVLVIKTAVFSLRFVNSCVSKGMKENL